MPVNLTGVDPDTHIQPELLGLAPYLDGGPDRQFRVTLVDLRRSQDPQDARLQRLFDAASAFGQRVLDQAQKAAGQGGLRFRADKVLRCADVGVGVQADVLAIGIQTIADEGFAQGREGAAEGSPAVGLVVFGPQQVDQRIAPLTFSADGQVGQEGDGFARVYLDWLTVALDARRAEQVQAEVGHTHQCTRNGPKSQQNSL